MSIDNLATVFGPTVVGYSSAEPTMSHIMVQTKQQQLVSAGCVYNFHIFLYTLALFVMYRRYQLFSEREVTFAICCRPVVCLSVVCNVRALYSAGSNFQQCFTPFGTFAIR